MKFIHDLSNEDYHSSDGISNSTLTMFSQDPHKPAWSKECPQNADKLATFDFGTALHTILLEPHLFESEFAVMPAFNLRTKAGKEEKESFYIDNEDKMILTADEHEKLFLMRDSALSHPVARSLLNADGIAEGSYYSTDSETGLLLKCRPDKYLPAKNLLLDVKSTPELAKFGHSVVDYRYHIQAAHYCHVMSAFHDGPLEFLFLAVAKNYSVGRHEVAVYSLPDEVLEYGQKIHRQNLRDYAEFLNHPPKLEPQELVLPWRFMDDAIHATNEVEF